MKLRPSIKIALGFGLITTAAFYGYSFGTKAMARNIQVPPLRPGKVNLIAISPGQGYRIIVANRVAQIIKGSAEEFEGKGSGEGGAMDANRPKIPMRDFIKSLDGDEEALSKLIIVLGKINVDQLPVVESRWKPDEIERALNGDALLQTKLEREINAKLDGTPLKEVRLSAIESGIVVDCPVEVQVNLDGKKVTKIASVPMNFRTQVAEEVSKTLEGRGPNVSAAELQGIYLQSIKAVGEKKEDIRARLTRMINPQTYREQFALEVERLLANATILANETNLRGVGMSSEKTTKDQEIYSIDLTLSPDGQKRLFKASVERSGHQMLFVVDGIAIAAPTIKQQVWLRNISINQLHDGKLVREAVDTMSRVIRGEKN